MEDQTEYHPQPKPDTMNKNELFLSLENDELRAIINAQKQTIEKLKMEIVHLLAENKELKHQLKNAE